MTDPAPFIGPRPFAPGDRDVFFGRDADTAELLSLVIAHPAALLYAVSGAGKTSLLSAGLIPALEARGFEVLPPLRLQAPDVPPGDANAFTYALLSGLGAHLDGADIDPEGTLADCLAALPRGSDPYGFPSPRVLILDQFEEVFTLHQDRWAERDALLADLAASLEQDPELRAVIALREEYVAQLERYAHLLPEALRARLHVERLRAPAALAAVTGPLRRAGVEFAPGVAESLIGDLLQTRVDLGDGRTVTVAGEYVEPVQLQVVCRTLWTRLAPGVRRVGAEDLAALDSVDESLVRYYDDAIAAAVARTGMPEYRLRDELERSLVTPAGTRATMFAGTAARGELPREALDELRDRHLLRAEWRAGGQWVELAHDRLIEPMRSSNALVRERRTRFTRRRAAALTATLLLVAGVAFGLLLDRGEPPRAPTGPSLSSLIDAYPGDEAPAEAVAAWMGRAARAGGIPAELPVMSALVESGLKNLQFGDRDSIGFFQMQKSVWNHGPYAGYARRPSLQLRWYINQANTVRDGWVKAGEADFGSDPGQYGRWAGDIGRPDPLYRGRYQLKLAEARALLDG